jgi:hypothetical protein
MRQLAQLALRREPAIIRSLFFLAPLIALLIPKTTVAMLIVLFLCCVGLEAARGGSLRDLFRVDMTLVLFGITAAYLFLNATWSLDPARAFTASTWFVLIVLMCFSSARALARWPERSLRGRNRFRDRHWRRRYRYSLRSGHWQARDNLPVQRAPLHATR